MPRALFDGFLEIKDGTKNQEIDHLKINTIIKGNLKSFGVKKRELELHDFQLIEMKQRHRQTIKFARVPRGSRRSKMIRHM